MRKKTQLRPCVYPFTETGPEDRTKSQNNNIETTTKPSYHITDNFIYILITYSQFLEVYYLFSTDKEMERLTEGR